LNCNFDNFKQTAAKPHHRMKSKTLSLSSVFVALGLLASPGFASATTYRYTTFDPAGADTAGNIDSIFTSYDAATQQLTWLATVDQVNGGALANGFWLVLSDGPNPKGISDEMPIYYFDATQSFTASGGITGVAPTLSAYAYNGQNAYTSYQTPGVELLSSTGLNWNSSTDSLLYSSTATTRTMGFTIDVSALNNSATVGSLFAANGTAFSSTNWQGADFGAQIGIWYHPFLGSVTYSAPGDISNISVAGQSYMDTAFSNTTVVPEPGSVILIALAGVALTIRRARRHVA